MQCTVVVAFSLNLAATEPRARNPAARAGPVFPALGSGLGVGSGSYVSPRTRMQFMKISRTEDNAVLYGIAPLRRTQKQRAGWCRYCGYVINNSLARLRTNQPTNQHCRYALPWVVPEFLMELYDMAWNVDGMDEVPITRPRTVSDMSTYPVSGSPHRCWLHIQAPPPPGEQGQGHASNGSKRLSSRDIRRRVHLLHGWLSVDLAVTGGQLHTHTHNYMTMCYAITLLMEEKQESVKVKHDSKAKLSARARFERYIIHRSEAYICFSSPCSDMPLCDYLATLHDTMRCHARTHAGRQAGSSRQAAAGSSRQQAGR